jgi:hypothetical protein
MTVVYSIDRDEVVQNKPLSILTPALEVGRVYRIADTWLFRFARLIDRSLVTMVSRKTRRVSLYVVGALTDPEEARKLVAQYRNEFLSCMTAIFGTSHDYEGYQTMMGAFVEKVTLEIAHMEECLETSLFPCYSPLARSLLV